MVVYTVAENETVSVLNTSTVLLAANARRKFARITNGSDVGVWVSYGEAAVIGQGDYLAATGGWIEIDADNMWRGAINGIAASGTNKVCGTVEFY